MKQLQDSRQKYEELENKHVRKFETKKSTPEAPVVVSKNPLAQKMLSKPSAPVPTSTNDDAFLREEILKDVQRTYQEKEFFTSNYVSELLSKVLFIWAKENPDIGYVQGVNELGASVIYVYFATAVDKERKYREFEGVVDE